MFARKQTLLLDTLEVSAGISRMKNGSRWLKHDGSGN